MIGRGALRNPFIFEQASSIWKGKQWVAPDAERYLNLIEQQKSLLNDYFDSQKAMLHARKFLSWYSSGFPNSSQFRKQVFTNPDEADLWLRAQDFFLKSVGNRDMKFLNEPFLMGGHG